MPSSKGESKKKKKKVRFEEPVDDVPEENFVVIPCGRDIDDDIAYFSQDRNWRKDFESPNLRYGKFTKEEDEKIKNSAFNYIKMRGWDAKEGVQAILHSSCYPDAQGCWLEIAKCLPLRPVKQINSRALRILSGDKRGKWSADELEILTNLHNIHGNDWKTIATQMDRSAQLCKDRWRHLKLVPTRKTGPWAQDEFDKLCKLVRRSLRIKASIPSKALDRRLLRDDINWEWIAEEMQRASNTCANVWYEKLASPMILKEMWANGDDRLLLQSLVKLGAASEESVDWDTVLDHRTGEVCMERWKEMTRLLGMKDHASFEDQVELLVKRYTPDLLGIEDDL